MKDLKEHLKDKQAEWLHILNFRYENEAGYELQEFAKGRLSAYTELIAWIEGSDGMKELQDD